MHGCLIHIYTHAKLDCSMFIPLFECQDISVSRSFTNFPIRKQHTYSILYIYDSYNMNDRIEHGRLVAHRQNHNYGLSHSNIIYYTIYIQHTLFIDHIIIIILILDKFHLFRIMFGPANFPLLY